MSAAKEKARQRDQFEHWLFAMDDILEDFIANFPGDKQSLDYSPESLKVVEQWLMDSFATIEDAEEEAGKIPLDRAARYIGETYRRNLGGKWNLHLKNPKYVHYGIPELIDMAHVPVKVCPLFEATTAIDRREGDMMTKDLLYKKEEQQAAEA